MKKRETESVGNEIPILSETVDHVPVYTVPNEQGFFPTGYKEVVSCPNCQIYQLPSVVFEEQVVKKKTKKTAPPPTLLSQGNLIFQDPSPGTPEEVVLVGECNGVIFYVTNQDVTLTLSSTELVLICNPALDCLYISFPANEELSHIHALFAARTNIYQAGGGGIIHKEQIESIQRSCSSLRNQLKDTDDISNVEHLIPDDTLHQSIYHSSVWIKKQVVLLSEVGAKQIEGHGERFRTSMRSSSTVSTNTSTTSASDGDTTATNSSSSNVHIPPKAVESASHIRRFSKTVCKAAEHVSDSISTVVGEAIGNSVVVQPTDTETTRAARQLLRTSVLAYGEISDGMEEAYETMSRATKKEATACVAVKYGEEAADLTRHTLGATNNFVKTALTCRRILNVKKVAKSSLKSAVKQSVVGKENI